MERARVNENGTKIVEMGKNRRFPGWYLKQSSFDGERWNEDWIRHYSTEYEAQLYYEGKEE